jgi:hypothetical protein
MGYNVSQLVVIGYTPSKTPPTNVVEKKASENNTMAMNFILSGLLDSKKFKVVQCTTTNELWDKVQDLYANQTALEMSKWKRIEEY